MRKERCKKCMSAYCITMRNARVAADPTLYDKQLAYEKARHARHVEMVLDHYGNSCECCGETGPKFLTVDHIEPIASYKKRVELGHNRMYSWLVLNDLPPGFRLLCSNCNHGRARNGGACPHQTGSQARAKARSRKCGEVPEDHGSVAQEMVEPLVKAKAAIYGNWSDNPLWPMDVMWRVQN